MPSTTLEAICRRLKIPQVRFRDETGRIRMGCMSTTYIEVTTPRGTFSAPSGRFIIDFGKDNLGFFDPEECEWRPEWEWEGEVDDGAKVDEDPLHAPPPPDEVLFGGRPVGGMNINEIREALAVVGLKSQGRKADLAAKLRRYVLHPLETLESEE